MTPKSQIEPIKSEPSDKKKAAIGCGCGCLTFIIIGIIIIFILGLISRSGGHSNGAKTTPKATATPTVAGTPVPTLTPKQTFVKTFMKESGLKEKTITNLYNVLTKKMGFKEVKYAGDEASGEAGYNITADNYNLEVYLTDYKLISIKNGSIFMYTEGKVKYTLKDVKDREISYIDGGAYYEMAKNIVKGSLKSPRSSKFPSYLLESDQIGMRRKGNYVIVQSYVDADNSFGANIRSQFTVEFQVTDRETYSYNPLYINIDGEESGTYIDLDKKN
jgi:hypothetical protein